MSSSISKQILTWINTLPGHFDGPDAESCFRAAWQDSGVGGDLEDFIAVLRGRGVLCHQIRGARGGEPPLYRMVLPGPSIGQVPHPGSVRSVGGMR